MASKPEATLTPLVAEGLRILDELKVKTAARDAAALDLKEKQAELDKVNEQLVALGAGRYRDEADHTCLVIDAIPHRMSDPSFVLKEGDLGRAKELAGAAFRKLFSRHETFSPKTGFDGIAGAVLTPAKARDIIQLCLIPGVMGGGRRAYVKWR
jgi:hypothetical protein